MNRQPTNFFDPEGLWEALLSRQDEQVRAAFFSLDEERKNAVYSHLQRMASEPGWHPEQRLSAQAALDVLKKES